MSQLRVLECTAARRVHICTAFSVIKPVVFPNLASAEVMKSDDLEGRRKPAGGARGGAGEFLKIRDYVPLPSISGFLHTCVCVSLPL